MKPIGGINTDVNPIDQPENTMRYAANGVISEQTGLAQSINVSQVFDNLGGLNFLGWVLGEHNIYAFVYNPGSLRGEIWRIDPDVKDGKELIIIDPSNILELDQEVGRMLQFVYQQDFQLHEVFAWAGQVKPKIIDIGDIIDKFGPGLPIDLTASGYTGKDFLLFPEGGMFNPDATAVDSGGNVSSGAWMFVYRYVYDDLSTTNWSGVGNVVYITEDSFTKNWSYQGDEGNRPTTKSIEIDFIVDTNQSANVRVQFGYVSIRNRVTYAGIIDSKSLPDLLVDPNNGKYIYTGETPEIDLGDNILELITPKALFNHVGTITSLTSRMYAGNLTTKADVNIQEIANDVVVTWALDSATGGKGAYLNLPTFGAGEVYALYISLLFDDGSESRAFHIPGRKTVVGDQDDIGTDPQIDAGTERWQLYDTTTVGGQAGYWINKGEEYPNVPEFASALDAGVYANNVRHHKMPSLGFIYHESIDSFDGGLPGIKLEFSNVDLSSLGTNVIGYNIHYAKRRYGEIINLAYDKPTPCGKPQGTTTLHAIAGNFGYSDQDPSVAPTAATDVIPSDKLMRFHAINLLTDFPSINPKYFVKEFRQPDTPLSSTEVHSDTYTDLSGTANVTLNYAYKYGAYNPIHIGQLLNETFPEVNRYIKIKDHAYVKNGVNFSFDGNVDLNNKVGEDAFIVANDAGFNGVVGTEVINEVGVDLERHHNGATAIYTFAALRAIPENISIPFDNQTLTFAKSFVRADTTPTVAARYGDTYNGLSQFNTTGVTGMGPDSLGAGLAVIDTTTDEAGMFKGEGSKIVHFTPVQCPINVVAQYASASDVQSHVAFIQGGIGLATGSPVYSDASLQALKEWYFYPQDIYQSFTFYYSDDFHERSEYFLGRINDGYHIDVNKFPTTLTFSRQEFSNVPIRFWRNWPAGNNFVQPSEKGEIINLKGAGNQMLYIHHRYSLYTTKDRLTLEGTGNVTLGSGDIFAVTPYEVVSVSEGHTGLQNRHWQTLSPFGYSWIQTDHGKVYAHNGKDIEESSANGLRIFFRDTIRKDMGDIDDAFSIFSDDLRRRMMVGINYDPNTDDIGYSISYSTTGGFWSFFHNEEYRMPIVVRDKNIFSYNFFAIEKLAGGSATLPFIIEAVFQDGTSNQKYLQYLKWNTNVWELDASGDPIKIDLEKTFDTLVIYSDTKLYGLPNIPSGGTFWEQNLFPYVGFPKIGENVRRVEDNWMTNSFRDIWDGSTEIPIKAVGSLGANPDAVDMTKTWDQKSRMRGKYFMVRLIRVAGSGEITELESIEFGTKQSIR